MRAGEEVVRYPYYIYYYEAVLGVYDGRQLVVQGITLVARRREEGGREEG